MATTKNKEVSNVIMTQQILMGTDVIPIVFLKSVVTTRSNLEKNVMMEIRQTGTVATLFVLRRVYVLMEPYNPSMKNAMTITL